MKAESIRETKIRRSIEKNVVGLRRCFNTRLLHQTARNVEIGIRK